MPELGAVDQCFFCREKITFGINEGSRFWLDQRAAPHICSSAFFSSTHFHVPIRATVDDLRALEVELR